MRTKQRFLLKDLCYYKVPLKCNLVSHFAATFLQHLHSISQTFGASRLWRQQLYLLLGELQNKGSLGPHRSSDPVIDHTACFQVPCYRACYQLLFFEKREVVNRCSGWCDGIVWSFRLKFVISKKSSSHWTTEAYIKDWSQKTWRVKSMGFVWMSLLPGILHHTEYWIPSY